MGSIGAVGKRSEMIVNEVHEILLDLARNVGAKFGLEYWRELDAQQAFPEDFWQEVCDRGLAGIAIPESYGGAGLGLVELAMVVEELARAGGGATVGQLFMLNPIFGGVALLRYGSEDLRDTLLPKLVSGSLRFCMALTEAEAGTNTLNISTKAQPVEDGWILRGSKMWITAVPQSDKMLVVARTVPATEVDSRTAGISLFLLDTDREGISHSSIEKVGTNTLTTSIVYFDDVFVRSHELLGREGDGWRQLLDILNGERIVTTAGLVGAGRLALSIASDYMRERVVFGTTPIGAYQGLQFPMAQAYAQLEGAAHLNRQAARMNDMGEEYGTTANIAKLLGYQGCELAIDRAMQSMGGMGYAKESDLERLWRDARLFKFAPVSEEMILNYIAVRCLNLPRSY